MRSREHVHSLLDILVSWTTVTETTTELFVIFEHLKAVRELDSTYWRCELTLATVITLKRLEEVSDFFDSRSRGVKFKFYPQFDIHATV